MHPFMLRSMYKYLGTNNEHEVSKIILSEYGGTLHSPKFLGSGGEGFVYSCDGCIHKFLVNWDYPKRNINETYKYLCLLSKKISNPRYLYEFSVRKVGLKCLHISYLAEPGLMIDYTTIEDDWKKWLGRELNNAMKEIYRTGFFLTDPSPSNFVIMNNCLRFIDYGADCIPIKEAAIKLGEMYFIKKVKKEGIYLWKVENE